jgi:hypothetical protein
MWRLACLITDHYAKAVPSLSYRQPAYASLSSDSIRRQAAARSHELVYELSDWSAVGSPLDEPLTDYRALLIALITLSDLWQTHRHSVLIPYRLVDVSSSKFLHLTVIPSVLKDDRQPCGSNDRQDTLLHPGRAVSSL